MRLGLQCVHLNNLAYHLLKFKKYTFLGNICTTIYFTLNFLNIFLLWLSHNHEDTIQRITYYIYIEIDLHLTSSIYFGYDWAMIMEIQFNGLYIIYYIYIEIDLQTQSKYVRASTM